MVDFKRKRFEFPADIWLAYRSDGIEIDKTYRPYRGNGYYSLIHMLCLDMRLILNNEISYWLDPPIASDLELAIETIDPEALAILDRVAELLTEPDNNLEELAGLYKEHEFLRPGE